MHDLEIRGAGEVLGENQSGNMMEVGFQLYNEMLSEAVRSLRSGREPDLLNPMSATTEINLHAPALLPDTYCGDVHTRLNLYKRLASADKTEAIDSLLEEITDRFGRLPAQGQTLFDTHRLRVLARPYGVAKIDAGPKLMNITFRPNPPIDPRRIGELVQKNRSVKLAGNDKLRIEREITLPADRAHFMRDLLRALGPPLKTEP
jgi:transcription-repair coupling factor (superfamily II helicase)